MLKHLPMLIPLIVIIVKSGIISPYTTPYLLTVQKQLQNGSRFEIRRLCLTYYTLIVAKNISLITDLV